MISAIPLRALAVSLVNALFYVFYMALIVRIVLSFVRLPPWHWAHRTIGLAAHAITEPILAPIRTLLHPIQRNSGWDFSPIVAWIIMDMLVRPLVLRIVLGL